MPPLLAVADSGRRDFWAFGPLEWPTGGFWSALVHLWPTSGLTDSFHSWSQQRVPFRDTAASSIVDLHRQPRLASHLVALSLSPPFHFASCVLRLLTPANIFLHLRPDYRLLPSATQVRCQTGTHA